MSSMQIPMEKIDMSKEYSVFITRWFDKTVWWPDIDGVSLFEAEAKVIDKHSQYGDTVGFRIMQKIGKGHYRPLESSIT